MASYTWMQTEDSVTVSIPLPKACTARQCAVSIHQSALEGGLKGQPPAIKGKLFQLVDADSSSWQIERDGDGLSLEITLFKVFPGPWPLVIKEGLKGANDMDAASHSHVGVCCPLVGRLWHGTMDASGIKLEGEKALADAVEWYKRAAELGHVESMCKLAYMYRYGPESGYPVACDVEQAGRYYAVAADAGSPCGQFGLGYFHQKGIAGSVDHAKAVHYYELAAANRCQEYAAQSHFNMALIFGNEGGNVELDLARTINHLERAAELGSGDALYNLAAMYAEGRHGLPRDEARANQYFSRARAINPAFERPVTPPLPTPSSASTVPTTMNKSPRAPDSSLFDIASTVLVGAGLVGAFYMHYRFQSKG